MHRVSKNVVSVFLPIFVLLVQFGYLFFVFYEIFSGYDAGVCPGYWYNNSSTLAPPDNGADTQVQDPDDSPLLSGRLSIRGPESGSETAFQLLTRTLCATRIAQVRVLVGFVAAYFFAKNV